MERGERFTDGETARRIRTQTAGLYAHIDRGYELIDEKLNGLGAQIERVKVKD